MSPLEFLRKAIKDDFDIGLTYSIWEVILWQEKLRLIS